MGSRTGSPSDAYATGQGAVLPQSRGGEGRPGRHPEGRVVSGRQPERGRVLADDFTSRTRGRSRSQTPCRLPTSAVRSGATLGLMRSCRSRRFGEGEKRSPQDSRNNKIVMTTDRHLTNPERKRRVITTRRLRSGLVRLREFDQLPCASAHRQPLFDLLAQRSRLLRHAGQVAGTRLGRESDTPLVTGLPATPETAAMNSCENFNWEVVRDLRHSAAGLV